MARTATRVADTVVARPVKPAQAVAVIPPPRRGHNSARDRLAGIVARLQRLDEEIKGLNRDKSDVFSEAKAAGIDVAGLRGALRYLRDPEKAEERDAATRALLAELEGLDATPSRAHVHVHAREATPDDGEAA